MPVYNGEKYLREALESILNQTFKDFELIILNDCSTDRSEDIVRSYSDARIVYIKNECNLGLIKTLNRGFDLAKGELIARMDQDDISLPSRFERQVAVFRDYPQIGVCGTCFTLFGQETEEKTIIHPEKPAEIKISLLSGCYIGHPTVMLRKKSIQGLRYDDDYQAGEDYEFWTRLSRITELYNIQESLLRYRWHQTNMSILQNTAQSENSNKIIGNQLSYVGIDSNDSNIAYCQLLFSNGYIQQLTVNHFIEIAEFANLLEIKNSKKVFYDGELLRTRISERLSYMLDRTIKDNRQLLPFLLSKRSDLIKRRGTAANLKLMAKIILKK